MIRFRFFPHFFYYSIVGGVKVEVTAGRGWQQAVALSPFFHRPGGLDQSVGSWKSLSQEILHHFRQDAPSDVSWKACFRKLYIKLPGFSYPFGPEKSSSRNFYFKSGPFQYPLDFGKNCAQSVYISQGVIGYLMYVFDFFTFWATSDRRLLKIWCMFLKFVSFWITSDRGFLRIRRTLPSVRRFWTIRWNLKKIHRTKKASCYPWSSQAARRKLIIYTISYFFDLPN